MNDPDGWLAVTGRSLARFDDAGLLGDNTLVYGGVGIRRCLTVVVPVPAEIAQAVVDSCGDLARSATENLLYDASWLHITVLDVTPSLLAGASTKTVVEHAREVVQAHPAFDVTIDGLAVFPSALVATVGPADNGIVDLRLALCDSLSQVLPASASDRAWLTVVRFRRHAVTGLAQLAQRFGRHDFGTFTVRSVHVLDTDKFYDRGHPRLVEDLLLA